MSAASAVYAVDAPSQPQIQLQPKVTGTTSIRAGANPNLYDIDAGGVEVKYVLEALARRSGANIVVGPEVTGEINAHLNQVSVEEILDFLSKAQSFKWEKKGTTYLVSGNQQPEKVSAPAPPAAKIDVAVIECHNIRTSDAIALIAKLFPDLTAAEGPNSITPKLNSSGASTSGTGYTGTSTDSSGGASTSTANATRIVLMGPEPLLQKAKDVIKDLDVPRKQVYLQVSVTEIGTTGSKDLGIEWTWGDILISEDNGSGIGFGKFTKDPMNFTGVLSALVKSGRANLLAQPNISVLDSENAQILIGDRLLFPKLVGYNQIGSPIYDKEEEDVGIMLQIAPRIAGDDEIVLSLYPQVSLVTSYLKTQAGDYPQISTREARTTVSVKNGSTLAIGGLLRNTEIVNASKIPILGDIPILGQLFRQSKKSKERTEIVIFVTPRIVEAAGSVEAMTAK